MKWPEIVELWKNRISLFGVEIEPIFRTLDITAPLLSDEEVEENSHFCPQLAWAETKEVRSYQIDFQRRVDDGLRMLNQSGKPMHMGNDPVYQTLLMRHRQHHVGALSTLRMLWDARGDIDVICAIFIIASYTLREPGSQKDWLKNQYWPNLDIRCEIEDLALNKIKESQIEIHWDYRTTKPFPSEYLFYVSDSDYRISEAEGLVRYLAEEHASILTRVCPIAINRIEERDPVLDAEIMIIEAQE